VDRPAKIVAKSKRNQRLEYVERNIYSRRKEGGGNPVT
jgi:hypothetical protein